MFNFNMTMVNDLERYLDLYYHKIIRLDLADDSYEIIMMRDSEPKPPKGDIKEWYAQFIQNYVHPEDRELFLAETSKEKMIEALDGESVNFTYRRKAGDEWALARFIFIPDGRSDTTGYIFIKEADL